MSSQVRGNSQAYAVSLNGGGGTFSNGPPAADAHIVYETSSCCRIGRPCSRWFWDNTHYTNWKYLWMLLFTIGRAMALLQFFIVVLFLYEYHDAGRFPSLHKPVNGNDGLPDWTIGIGSTGAGIVMLEMLLRMAAVNLPGYWFSWFGSVLHFVWSLMVYQSMCPACAGGSYSTSTAYISVWFLLGAVFFAFILAPAAYDRWGTEPLADGETLDIRVSNMKRQNRMWIHNDDIKAAREQREASMRQTTDAYSSAALLSGT